MPVRQDPILGSDGRYQSLTTYETETHRIMVSRTEDGSETGTWKLAAATKTGGSNQENGTEAKLIKTPDEGWVVCFHDAGKPWQKINLTTHQLSFA